MSDLAQTMLLMIRNEGLPEPRAEYQFFKGRRWKFDFAYPIAAVAIEVEGGMWTRGRHTRPLGFDSDCEKYSLAAVLGWTVIRVTEKMIHDGRALNLIRLTLTEYEDQRDNILKEFTTKEKNNERRKRQQDKPRIQGNAKSSKKASSRKVNKAA